MDALLSALTVIHVVATGAFTWRAYKSVTPYGWA